MGLIIGGVSAQDLILDGSSVSLYVGGNPPTKVWPTWKTVQITLGTGYEARDQLRAALADRGLDYQTVTEIPFDIELVGSGSANMMFYGCASLTSVPDMDTSNVTDMSSMFDGCSSLTTVPDMDTSSVTNMSLMFYDCSSLTHLPDLDTSQVTNTRYMFYNCSKLTDGNVRLIGKHPQVDTTGMIANSGLTREPFDTVQITLGTGIEARNQFLAALSARGLDHTTITEVPFEIELVGTGTTSNMFRDCYALTTAPAMDTSNVTSMERMFQDCYSLTYVPDMDTSNVTRMLLMFSDCSSLTDGNVRLIGKHPSVGTSLMIDGSGLTQEPFYTADGRPWPITEVHQVSLSNRSGQNTAHSLVTVTVPAGETWSVRVQGTIQSTFGQYPGGPQIRIGSSTSSRYGNNATVDYSGTITSTNRTIALVTSAASWAGSAGFNGTVTIEK